MCVCVCECADAGDTHNGSMRSPSSMRFVGFVCLTTICQFNCLSVCLAPPPLPLLPHLPVCLPTLCRLCLHLTFSICMTSLGRMRSWSRSLVVVAVTNVEGIGLACSQQISGKNSLTLLPLPVSSQVQLPRQGKEAQLAVIRLIKQQKVVVALTSNTQTKAIFKFPQKVSLPNCGTPPSPFGPNLHPTFLA